VNVDFSILCEAVPFDNLQALASDSPAEFLAALSLAAHEVHRAKRCTGLKTDALMVQSGVDRSECRNRARPCPDRPQGVCSDL
jgi:hypothetical protein